VLLAEDADVPRRSIQVIAEMASPAPAAVGSDRTQIFQPPAGVAPQAQPRARLVLAAFGSAHSIPLESTSLTIGRGLNNDIILEDTRVSRHHAQLRYQARRFWIADLGSTNGTYVNDEQVAERSLRDGDIVSLGGLELTFKES
jgi:pSer/pThr/pTyr-binding forkhead associated (FHA) protein